MQDPDLTRETVRSCSDLLSQIRFDPVSHPQIASAIHRHAYGMLNNPDPFKNLKEQSNIEALSVCNRVEPALLSFRDLVLASIIGNTYDYGVKSHHVTENFDEFFSTMFSKGLTVDDTDRILPLTKRVVYFTDNCGEIIFDRLLLQYLHENGSEITLVVRDAPILNDATMAEASELGLGEYVTTITTTGCGTETRGAARFYARKSLKRPLATVQLSYQKEWQITNRSHLKRTSPLSHISCLSSANPLQMMSGYPEVRWSRNFACKFFSVVGG